MNRVKAARKLIGISKQQLANRAGCHLNTITRAESGKNVGVDMAVRITKALGAHRNMFYIWSAQSDRRET